MRNLVSIFLVLIVFFPHLLFADIKVYFSPNGGCQAAVISQIQKAHKTIDIAMYYFTSREIAQTLIKAKKRGVSIRMVLDRSQRGQIYSKSKYFIKKGLAVKYHEGSGLMHNKFAVIDGEVLVTGSFNWTATAEQKNEENLLVISGEDLSREYEKRFEYLWMGSGDRVLKNWENK